MAENRRVTRRGFLRTLAAGTFGVPAVVRATALAGAGRVAASDRIAAAAIGAGGRGRYIFGSLCKRSGVQGVAVCDVQQDRLEPFRRSGLAVYRDFREMLARGDLDVVVVASPSHWKPLHTIAAAKAGADVYCEKPMSLTIRDGRAMADAVRRYGRIFQHGTQQRSSREFRFACEMVRSGRIGALRFVEVYVGGPPRDCHLPAEPVPKGIDWDLWLGPAPWRPFHSAICMRGCGAWEGFRDYSGGGMTGWGSHHFDIAQWGLAADETGPVRVVPPDWRTRRGVTFTYASGVEVRHTGQMGEWAVVFHGGRGRIAVNRGKLQSWPASIMREPIGPEEVHLYTSPGHGENFLHCVRTRQRAVCDVEIGHRTMSVCHLGNIAYWLRRPLKWDPAAERFLGDAEADRLLNRARREPWRI
jgi:predicted dehydrogenase